MSIRSDGNAKRWCRHPERDLALCFGPFPFSFGRASCLSALPTTCGRQIEGESGAGDSLAACRADTRGVLHQEGTGGTAVFEGTHDSTNADPHGPLAAHHCCTC